MKEATLKAKAKSASATAKKGVFGGFGSFEDWDVSINLMPEGP